MTGIVKQICLSFNLNKSTVNFKGIKIKQLEPAANAAYLGCSGWSDSILMAKPYYN